MAASSLEYIHPKSQSFLSRLIKTFLVVARQKGHLGRQLSDLEKFKNDPAPVPKSVQKTCTVKEESFAGRVLWTLGPKEGTSPKAIFYIHGGGYVFNMAGIQWNYLAKVVKETQATIMVTNYPLAPQSNVEAALAYLTELYPVFLNRYKGNEVFFLADSAGGGLAISFAQHCTEIDLPQPQEIILSSPWLDVSMTNPDIQSVIPKDKALEITSLQKAGKLFAGDLDTKDPKVSPIYGRFDNIARISMFMGTAELFVSDARKLVARLKRENIHFNYYEYPKMIHCWLLIGMPEGKVAFGQIIDLIKQ